MSEKEAKWCSACGRWRINCRHMKGHAESESAPPFGYVQNGVVATKVICIGCKQEFEDLYLADEEPDANPVCDKCIETMEP